MSCLTAHIALVEVVQEPLQLTRYTDFVQSDSAGAIATFTGVTRDNFQGKRVVKLEYEAYAPMATKKLQVRGRPSGGALPSCCAAT